MRKLLRFRNEAGELVRVLWSEGVCVTPDALAKVVNGGYEWESIKTSGETWKPMDRMRFVSKKLDANNPEFLGIQNPPKAQPKPVEKNEDGTDKAPKRGRKGAGVSPELLKSMTALAEAGKTLKEAEKELGVSYATLYVTAKKEKIAFKAGQKGRKKVDKPAASE